LSGVDVKMVQAEQSKIKKKVVGRKKRFFFQVIMTGRGLYYKTFTSVISAEA
jgi:hypothetical protein